MVFTPATRMPLTSRSWAVPKFRSTRPFAWGECAAIQIRRQDLYRLFLHRLADPPLRRPAPEPVNHGFVPALLQRVQQPLHLPRADSQLSGRLALRNQLLFSLL